MYIKIIRFFTTQFRITFLIPKLTHMNTQKFQRALTILILLFLFITSEILLIYYLKFTIR